MKSLSKLCLLVILILLVGCKPQADNPAPAPQQDVQAGNDNTIADETAQQTVVAPPPVAPPPVVAPPPPATPISCSDSDAGSTSQKGSTMVSMSDGTSTSESDSCASAITLIEKSCSGSVSQSSTVTCSNGCVDGACASGAAPSSSLASLQSFPQMFQGTDLKIVLGDTAPVQHVQAAVEIATSLTAALGMRVESKLASEVPDPSAQSLLVIGNACDNPATAALLGNPSPCSDDVSGEGKIRIAQANGKTYVFVTGSDSQDLRKAARLLARYKNYSLSGTTIRVGGDLAKPIILGTS